MAKSQLTEDQQGLAPADVPKPDVQVWSISIEDVFRNSDQRLDASHYDLELAAALRELKDSGFPLVPLSELAELHLPSMFTRIWADDNKYGIEYINATELMSLAGLGVPSSSQRYLSKQTDTNIDSLLVREGWLLLTCSGTIGRVFYVSKRLHLWAATHDIIRIIPKKETHTGFLYAYLSSEVAQKQILSHTHGGQIDHITDVQISKILVPDFGSAKIKKIHEQTMSALYMREQAIQELHQVGKIVESTLKK